MTYRHSALACISGIMVVSGTSPPALCHCCDMRYVRNQQHKWRACSAKLPFDNVLALRILKLSKRHCHIHRRISVRHSLREVAASGCEDGHAKTKKCWTVTMLQVYESYQYVLCPSNVVGTWRMATSWRQQLETSSALP